MYRDGQGVEINLQQAEIWIRKAATQGDPDAKLALEQLTSEQELKE